MKKGIYQHYKGQHYEVLDTANHTETLEELVVYRALYGAMELWVRPLKMFTESIELNNTIMPRFRFISKQNAEEFLRNQD